MAKFLLHASYTPAGTRGLLEEGGASRQNVVRKMIEGLGGSLECFYYNVGDVGGVAIVDLPDHMSVAAVSMAIGATGSLSVKTTMLLTAEEMDAAVGKPVAYTGPGA